MATRYIDFTGGSDSNDGLTTSTPWKRCKGMVGVTGTAAAFTPSGGDTIVFKKGVTWTASFPWNLSGGSSSAVTYTTEVGFGTGTQPTFDYQHNAIDGAGNGIYNGASWTTVNDLKFVNAGTALTLNQIKACYYDSCHDVSITNCTFACECWISIYFLFDAATSYSNFTLTGNDWSACGSAVWMATSGNAGTTMHNLYYVGNTIHDFTSQIGGTAVPDANVHGDGFLHYFSNPHNDSTQYLDGVTFANNRAYGDFRRGYGDAGAMTAFFFTEGAVSADIFNNDFSYSGTQASNQFESLITISNTGNTHVTTLRLLNNTFATDGTTNQMSDGVLISAFTAGSSILFKNNIIFTPQTAVWWFDTTTGGLITSDYNLLTSNSAQFGYDNSGGDLLQKTYAQWQALGYDAHSLLGSDPLFVSAPSNNQLGSSSPCRTTATNLSGLGITYQTLLNSDRNGTSRGSSWDMGAYQFSSSPPPPPSGPTLSAAVMQ